MFHPYLLLRRIPVQYETVHYVTRLTDSICLFYLLHSLWRIPISLQLITNALAYHVTLRNCSLLRGPSLTKYSGHAGSMINADVSSSMLYQIICCSFNRVILSGIDPKCISIGWHWCQYHRFDEALIGIDRH